MPPEMIASSSLALSDVLTIIGVIVTVVVQSWVFLRWLSTQLGKRDEALAQVVRDREEALSRLMSTVDRVAERDSLARSKIETRVMRLEDRVAHLVTQDQLRDVFRQELVPIKDTLRTALALPPVRHP